MPEVGLDQPRPKVFDQEKTSSSFDHIINKEFIPPQVIEGENGSIGFFCDKGLRKFNEDALVINNRVNAFVSIDGMGGAGNFGDGKKAAAILAYEFQKFFQKGWDLNKVGFIASEKMLQNGIKEGGACYLAGKINNAFLDIYQAGDLRLIVINKDGRLNFETKDQRIHRETPEGLREYVTSAVTGENAGRVNHYRFRLDYGDRIIVGSDGLWDNLSTEQIIKFVQKKNTSEAIKKLKETSLSKMGSEIGKKDNINVLVYDYFKPAKPRNILEANNFGELYHDLYLNGPIKGSKQTYSPEELIKTIDSVRYRKISISYITQTLGLREKVRKLLWKKS